MLFNNWKSVYSFLFFVFIRSALFTHFETHTSRLCPTSIISVCYFENKTQWSVIVDHANSVSKFKYNGVDMLTVTRFRSKVCQKGADCKRPNLKIAITLSHGSLCQLLKTWKQIKKGTATVKLCVNQQFLFPANMRLSLKNTRHKWLKKVKIINLERYNHSHRLFLSNHIYVCIVLLQKTCQTICVCIVLMPISNSHVESTRLVLNVVCMLHQIMLAIREHVLNAISQY